MEQASKELVVAWPSAGQLWFRDGDNLEILSTTSIGDGMNMSMDLVIQVSPECQIKIEKDDATMSYL